MESFINFKDQVCLITGAGSETGIGFNAAKILGGLGGRIALVATTDRIFNRARELADMGIEAKGYIANLMDREQTARMGYFHQPQSDLMLQCDQAGASVHGGK